MIAFSARVGPKSITAPGAISGTVLVITVVTPA
jgi:hypothetical protein